MRVDYLQVIDWSHLPPGVVPISSGVTVLAGQNGSGKSSSLDAIKAVLGARRFGQGRSAHDYIHASAAGIADRAVVILGITHDEEPMTLVMRVSRRMRRFALREGHLTIDCPDDDRAVDAFLDEVPASAWRAPEAWQSDVMGPMGIGPAMIRLLELPQGEMQRMIHARADEALAGLLGLMGHSEQQGALEAERRRIAEVRRLRDEARAHLVREQARAYTLRPAGERADEARRIEQEIARLESEAQAPDAHATHDLLIALLDPDPSDRGAVAAALGDLLGARVCDGEEAFRQAVADGVGAVLLTDESAPAEVPGSLRSLARPRCARTSALLHRLGLDDLVPDAGGARGGCAFRAGRAFDVQSGPDPRTRLRAEIQLLARQRERLGSWDELREAERRWEEAAADIHEAERILGDHEESLARLAGTLDEAERLWREEVTRQVHRVGERFGALCARAGWQGEVSASFDDAGGARLMVRVRTHPEATWRHLFAAGELSGGWRAAVTLMLVLAAIAAAGDAGAGVVLLDEHAANLDEDRLAELGGVFARLSEEEGMQFLLCLPTRRAHEEIAWADQVIGYLPPAAGAHHAPAPVLIRRASGGGLGEPGHRVVHAPLEAELT